METPLDHTIVEKYFPNLTDLQREQFRTLGGIYAFWNARVNLISRKDFDFLYLRHVLHALGVAKIIQFNAGTQVLDIGTGGGFPGIPLAIMFPETKFHLVDSIGKKINVVNDVRSVLNLDNVTTRAMRVEHVKGPYDFAVGRAVTAVEKIEGWIKNKIAKDERNTLKNGLLYFRGSNDPIIRRTGMSSFPLRAYFSEDFFETKLIIHLPSFFSLSQKKRN